MHSERLLPDPRNAAIGGGLLLALAVAAIFTPAARADVIVPVPPRPTVPTAVTPPPAPLPSVASSSPSSTSTGQQGAGTVANPTTPGTPAKGLPRAPNGPENEPELPDLPEIGQGCDVGCLEGWAADAHAWILAYGLTPLSRYNAADFEMLQGIVTDLAGINEEIATALTATRTTLTDAITDSDGSAICSHDDTPGGDVVLCPY